MCPRRRGHCFTLIEVLIVVVIMAVLAAVVIPQFSSATDDAKLSALEYNLKVMREQVQIYAAHHLGEFPDIQNDALPQLTGATDLGGNIGAPGPAFPFGPYIKEALPVNPFDQSNVVTAVQNPGQRPTQACGPREGWLYDKKSGAVWPNHPEYYKSFAGEAEAETLPIEGP
jgi:prepilin-type N-terminal cleavage/methylation domain-containing protein